MSALARGIAALSALVCLLCLNAAVPSTANASCNLIPTTAPAFASTQGGVRAPIAAPGEVVQIELNGCDDTAGFVEPATSNEITITFEPPTGPINNTDVVVSAGLIDSVGTCILPGGRCRTLRFRIPDTTANLPPYGLAGPARITVRDPDDAIVAEIADLSLPALSCDKSPETVFQKFTILPAPGNFKDIDDNTTTELLATVDGGDNLLIPLDYWGDGTRSVLVGSPGAPEARFIEGTTPLETFTGSGTTITEAIATALANDAALDATDFVRSFTLTGRPLPPLLRVKKDGTGLYGTADAVASVLRFKRNDGSLNGLYDVTDRLFMDRGPIVISAPTLSVQTPLPLKSLRSSTDSVAYARDESRESLNINPDVDQGDLVTQIVDGTTAAITNTQEAVCQIANNNFVAPAITASADRVAYLLSERDQANGAPLNGDGEDNDVFLRAFLSDGTQLHPNAPFLDADSARMIDRQPMAMAGSKVLFRTKSPLIEASGYPFTMHPSDIAISPDGNQIYVANVALGFQTVSWASIDPLTGALSSFTNAAALGELSALAITPDGANVYAAQFDGPALWVFERDTLTGDLTIVESQVPPVLLNPRYVAISPDSNFIYVTGAADEVDVFERTGASGELTFVETVGFDAPVSYAEAIEISPDGKNVYATGMHDGRHAIVTFSRNLGTGQLTLIDTDQDGLGGVQLNTPMHLAVSPDGRHVYVPNGVGDSLAIFERDAGTGELTQVGLHFNGEEGAYLSVPVIASVSPDGRHVYVTCQGFPAGALTVLRRNPETGALLSETNMLNGVGGFRVNLFGWAGGAGRLAVRPDPYDSTGLGTVLYFPGAGVVVLRMDHSLAALETDSCAPNCDLLATQSYATRVTVAGEDAAFLRPESGDLVDRNGTGDPNDDIVWLFDTAGGGSTTSLDIAGNRLAASSTLLAFTVPEGNEGGGNCGATIPPGGCDLNGDADADDDVLHVYELAPGPGSVINTGLTATRIAVSDDTVVFLSADDGTLRLYEYDSGTNSGVSSTIDPATDFILGGGLVAFRTNEADVGQSLNTDADTTDEIMRVYDLSSASLTSTGRSAIECRLPGCDANLPYKVTDGATVRTVAFLTDERDEAGYPAGDLDLDGDAEDIVLTLYSVRANKSATISTVMKSRGCDSNADCAPTQQCNGTTVRCEDLTPPEISPFPDEPLDGTLAVNETRESELGDLPAGGACDEEDINADGDCDDEVVVLVGDADEDGSVDDSDVCSEIEADDQTDNDADRLGDVDCDPNAPPDCGTSPRLTCRAAGKASFQFKNDAMKASKKQLKFSWGQGAETLMEAFGNPLNDLGSSYALCIYDGSGASQPVLRSLAIAGRRYCGKKRCWSIVGNTGFKFGDKEGVPFGMTGVNLASGGNGKAKVGARGKGANLAVPDLTALQTPLTVQLVVNTPGGEECWSATFNTPDTQDAKQWKAKF